jgi:predicted AAA+ superfamily ATPase
MEKELLRQVIYEQRSRRLDVGFVERKIDQGLIDSPEILVITGVRRCGKSVLLQQIRKKQKEQDYFLNFDDERLINFTVADFQILNEVFMEEFGVQHIYYFDEIQNITGWERFVSRIYSEGNKVCVTGSNAKMLSRELGTYLTGRHVTKQLYPFSFSEYLKLKKVEVDKSDLYTSAGRAKLTSMMNEYLQYGGFPRYADSRDNNYLSSLYRDIIFRDVIVRNNITNEIQIREMMIYLASNATHRFTYNSIAKLIGIKNPDTIKNYIKYVEDTYLVKQLTKFDNSVSTQMRTPKKIYFIDNAIISKIGFNATDNQGAKLENAVMIELIRRSYDVFYYSGNSECDFIIRKGNKIVEALQVTISLDNTKTYQREMKGLLEAMETYGLDEGYIITLNDNKDIEIEGKNVHIVSVWKWMMEG